MSEENDFSKSLFLVPIVYDGEPMILEKPDYELHATADAKFKVDQSAQILLNEEIPKEYTTAKEIHKGSMHFRKIKSPRTNEEFIPLFTSLDAMFNIFTKNIHIGIVTYDDAKSLSHECSGIVIGPGTINKIIHN